MASVTAGFAIPAGTPARLAATRPAPRDLALLHAALHSRRLVLFKALLTRLGREAVDPATRAGFDRDWRLLELAEAHDPQAAGRALDYPSVGGWLAHALNAPDASGLAAALPHLGEIALSVAVRTGAPFSAKVPTVGGDLVLPGLGRYRAGTATVRVVSGPHGMLLSPQGRRSVPMLLRTGGQGYGPGWRGLPVLPGSRARLDGLVSLRAPSPQIRPPSDAARASAWTARWRAATALLESADPWRAAEVVSLVRSVVPMADVRDGPSSSTLRAAPWAVHTALPATAQKFAEVLVHELAHSKLAVLGDLVPLHRANGDAVHRVAWRPDPRPFAGVLQGTYAHLALSDLWSRVAERPGAGALARKRARARCEDYREQIAGALPILLESHQLTPAGREFILGMRRHHRDLGRPGTSFALPDGLSVDGDVR